MDARRCVLALLVICGLASNSWALINNNVGGSGAQFLRLGPGARPLGLGEAYGALARGAEALYWNPAGLAILGRPELSFSHSEYLSFFHHEHLAYGMPVRAFGGAIGASLTLLTQDSLSLVNNANQTIGSYSPHSEVFTFGYARTLVSDPVPDAVMRRASRSERENVSRQSESAPLDLISEPGAINGEPDWPEFQFGVAGKVITETIYDRSATAIAVDAGVLAIPWESHRLALSGVLRNLGTPERFADRSEYLPLELSAGAAYDRRTAGAGWLFATELSMPYYGLASVKGGVEYARPVSNGFSGQIRFGYKTLTAPSLGPLSGVTIGAGLSSKRLRLDFGFQPLGDLGESYRFSAGFKF